MQVVEDLTDRLDDESRSYVEIGASDDEEEEDQIIMVQMARGRAFDSDTSGSGSRGVRGPGRSARGRGGIIPPSSSASSDPHISLSLIARHIYPSSRASRQIMRIIKLQLHKEGYTWDAVPQEARDFYWEEFRKHFIWDEAITAMLKVAWEKICADRYADFTYRMRRSGKKQQCVSQEIWESWQKAWEDPAFKRKREIFAQNRRSETGGDGAGPSRHTSGAISAKETSRLLENYTTARKHVVSSQIDESELSQELMRRYLGHPSRHYSTSSRYPLGDLTSDGADEQPLRFDFGPF
ncbi:hypothetical protein JCGZ_15499 [Jatropha curcas]|uniref:Uncharacterized protein n=1 Tax=Jatropha curcas TaxID=180498 RepID=A0A067KF51_JATCU|nr:hypothetical protein JCGZ_15499 [Jatropha curcas]